MQEYSESQSPVYLARDSFLTSLFLLNRAGISFSSVIDIGCADGTFSLQCLDLFGSELSILNIDAQSIYEPSLIRIKDVVGGEYRICAISSTDSKVKFFVGSHSYWAGIGDGAEGMSHIEIESRKLDSLLEEIDLPAPYVIKMDIEGGEFQALQGAVKTLTLTSAVILETDIYYAPHSPGNFLDIYSFLGARGFSLFDMTNFGYRQTDQSLFQIYSTFLNREVEFRDQYEIFEDEERQEATRISMIKRREALLRENEELLRKLSESQRVD